MPGSAISASQAIPAACSEQPADHQRAARRSGRPALPASGATVMNVAVHGISRSPAAERPVAEPGLEQLRVEEHGRRTATRT